MQQVAWGRVLVAQDRGRRVEVAPSAQPRAAQDAADRGRAGTGAASDLVARHVPATQLDNALIEALGQTTRAAAGPRTAIHQTLDPAEPETRHPLARSFGTNAEGGRGRLPRASLRNNKPA
jgi:hypothetical protein